MTQDELVDATEIPKATLQRILSGKATPGEARLQLICDALGLTVAEILTGGDRLSASTLEVPINDIRVSAGPGRFALNEDQSVGTWPFPREWVSKRFGDSRSLRIVTVSGDSQEPDLRDGDLLMIDLAKSALLDGMHVVRLDDTLMIKRVQIEGGRVKLKSANPSYDDIIIDLATDQDRFQVVAKAEVAVKVL